MIRLWFIPLFILSFFSQVTGAQSGFHADSAYAFLQHLCETIGPRPMGSKAERRALHWVTRQLHRFGADTAYTMPITQYRFRGRVVNTRSGIAVGLFRGKTDSTIVIGSHLDSAGPEMPGANDNASGTACMLELARVWGQRERHYTLLFAAFGGEEQGLIGSRHFVEHYDSLHQVVLMLQIDMAGSDEAIIPFFEVRHHQAPAWLLRDAYATDRQLGYRSLFYPTHFFALNQALNGASSDHQPFLEKGIPAIDFTAGLNSSPIHTPRDRLDFIQPHMLERSGRLVDGLLQKYQRSGIPDERQGNYLLYSPFGIPLFLPPWLLWSLIYAGVVLAGMAYLFSRKSRLAEDEAPKVRFSGLKILLLWFGIIITTQLGETLMQWITGYRHPWMTHITGYVVYALFWGAAGAWLALRIGQNWRFSPEPHIYFKRPLIFYALFTFLFSLHGPRLAVYPATALLLLSLAFFIARPVPSFVLAALSLAPMFRLVFSEAFPFYMRSMATGSFVIDSFKLALLQSIFIVLFLTFWFWPVPYTFVWLRYRVESVNSWRYRFIRPEFGLALLGILIAGTVVLSTLPAYNARWCPVVRVQANYDPKTATSELSLRATEYLRGITLQADTLTKRYSGRMNADRIKAPFSADWFIIQSDSVMRTANGDTVQFDWRLTSKKPWLRVELTVSSDSVLHVIHAEPAYEERSRTLRFVWEHDPPETLQVGGTLAFSGPVRSFRRTVTAVYRGLPPSVRLQSDLHDVIARTQVVQKDTLKWPGAINRTGE